jgi:chromosome segregation ATPase
MKKHREEMELMKRDLHSEEDRRNVAKKEYDQFLKKKTEYEEQIKQQEGLISFYKIDNKKELNDYMKNEEALIEYKTLTFKQSTKIKELKDEIELMNKKFPQEVSKYTKEIEFLKADIENKKSELEYKFQSSL